VIQLSDDQIDDDEYISLATFSNGGLIITWRVSITQSLYDDLSMSASFKKVDAQSGGFGITSVESSDFESGYQVTRLNGESFNVVINHQDLYIRIHRPSVEAEGSSTADEAFKYTHLNPSMGTIFDLLNKDDDSAVLTTYNDDQFGILIMGDNIGKLYYSSSIGDPYVSQVHDGRITGIAHLPDDMIVTCSTDRTIKLWLSSKNNKLQQVGQYFGFSAFTCVTVVNDVIICGDVRGHVFQIRIKKSGLEVKEDGSVSSF